MSEPTLLSIQVGDIRTLEGSFADGAPAEWTTGFFKDPVTGPVFVHETKISGDAQADLENHGGRDKAVLAYSADHYPRWSDELGEPSMPYGGFGENLTIAGLNEHSVCLGDVWTIGPVEFEVSQPRQPCWKLARRWKRPDLPKRVIATGRTGWYLRVLSPGAIAAPSPVTLKQRPHPDWPVARASDVMYDRQAPLELLDELSHVSVLADSWRSNLAGRALRRRITAHAAQRVSPS